MGMIHAPTFPEGEIFLRYINNRFNKNKNFIGVTTGPTGCLSKDTKLYGQDKTIERLYKSGNIFIDTYSLTKVKNKDGTYYPIKSKSEIIPSGKKEVYEIELEDGRKVIATSEHKLFKKDKKNIIEVKVKDLDVGDSLRAFPKDYISNFYKGAKDKEQLKRDTNWEPFKKCSRCGNLFYVKKSKIKSSKKCRICRKIKLKEKNRDDLWYGWEDNLLRQFYHNKSQEYLMDLMKHRSWVAIRDRAKRLKILRSHHFQWENNQFTSQNNPMHNPILKEKAMIKQAPIFARNKMTSIEKPIAEFLDSINVKYDFNKIVRTKSSFRFPDFKIGNLIIECDGEYWHQDKIRDNKREKELTDLGFEVIRFTGTEINKNMEEVKKCIVQRLNQ